jgi:hypothetical protein
MPIYREYYFYSIDGHFSYQRAKITAAIIIWNLPDNGQLNEINWQYRGSISNYFMP